MAVAAGQKVTASLVNSLQGVSVVGGLVRITNAGSTSGSTELAWATTPTLSLAASTQYVIEVEVQWLEEAANLNTYVFRLRQTNISGSILGGAICQPEPASGGAPGGPWTHRFQYPFNTGVAVNQAYCGTVQRITTTTGSCQVAVPSSIIVKAVGPAGILSTA